VFDALGVNLDEITVPDELSIGKPWMSFSREASREVTSELEAR